MIETFNTMDRPLISYTKIQLKKGTIQYKVLIFNINLTFIKSKYSNHFFVLLL